MKEYSIQDRIALESALMTWFGFSAMEAKAISISLGRRVRRINGAVAPLRRVGYAGVVRPDLQGVTWGSSDQATTIFSETSRGCMF